VRTGPEFGLRIERASEIESEDFSGSVAINAFGDDEDRPMSSAWELGLIYLVSEILLNLTRRSCSKTGTKQDRSTLGILWLVIAVSVMAGVFVVLNFGDAALPHGRMFASAGVVLFAAGLILRWWAIITLGRFFHCRCNN
jgi:hypothetical protein